MLLAEVLGELLAIELVEVLAGVGQLVSARHHKRVVGVVDDTLQMRHLHGVYLCSHMVADKEQLGIGVIDDVVNLLSHKLMKDGYSNGTIGQRSQEGYSPLTAVATTEGYLVALLHTTILEKDVELLNLAGNIMKLQGGSLVVCQGIKVPIIDDAVLY